MRSQEVKIEDIPIVKITGQYLDAISYMRKLDIDVTSDFVNMAAWLIYTKSKFLLPVEIDPDSEEFEDPRRELIDKLLEYQKFKKVADVLEKNETVSNRLVERKNKQMTFDIGKDDHDQWEEITLFELLKVFSEVIKEIPAEDFLSSEAKEFTTEGKIKEMINLLKEHREINFYALFKEKTSKMEIMATFLAILEIYKIGFIHIKQHIVFADIYIFKKENVEIPDEESLSDII